MQDARIILSLSTYTLNSPDYDQELKFPASRLSLNANFDVPLGITSLAPRRGPSQEAPECSSTPMAPSVVMTFTHSKWHGTVLDSWTFQLYYLSYLRIAIRSAQIRSWHVMLSISWLDSASLDPLLASCLPPLPRMID